MKKLDFIYFDAGGGHRAAANALRAGDGAAGAAASRSAWSTCRNCWTAWTCSAKLTGLRLEDLYNLMLKKGWTLGSPQLTGGHAPGDPPVSRQGRCALLEEFWRQSRPDMVVSLVPNFNRALCESLARALPGVPLVTILTDIADYPPHFWIEEKPGAAFHLRVGQGGGAGARAGAPASTRFTAFRA